MGNDDAVNVNRQAATSKEATNLIDKSGMRSRSRRRSGAVLANYLAPVLGGMMVTELVS